MGWWQNVDKLYLRDAFLWGVKKAERRRRQREAAWQEEQQQQDRQGPNWGQVAGVAFGVAQATTFTNVGDFQPGQGGTFDQNWADYSISAQQDKRSNDLEQGTLDQGNRNRGTNQR